MGKDAAKRCRELVEDRIRQGVEESVGLRTKWGLILGGERFAHKVRQHLNVGRRVRKAGRLDDG